MSYLKVRDVLEDFVGQTLIGVSQMDEDEYAKDHIAYVMLHFETGGIKITLEDSKIGEFEYGEEEEP